MCICMDVIQCVCAWMLFIVYVHGIYTVCMYMYVIQCVCTWRLYSVYVHECYIVCEQEFCVHMHACCIVSMCMDVVATMDPFIEASLHFNYCDNFSSNTNECKQANERMRS